MIWSTMKLRKKWKYPELSSFIKFSTKWQSSKTESSESLLMFIPNISNPWSRKWKLWGNPWSTTENLSLLIKYSIIIYIQISFHPLASLSFPKLFEMHFEYTLAIYYTKLLTLSQSFKTICIICPFYEFLSNNDYLYDNSCR